MAKKVKPEEYTSPWRIEREGLGYTNYWYVVRGYDTRKEYAKVIGGTGKLQLCHLNEEAHAQLVADELNAGRSVDVRVLLKGK